MNNDNIYEYLLFIGTRGQINLFTISLQRIYCYYYYLFYLSTYLYFFILGLLAALTHSVNWPKVSRLSKRRLL